MVHGQNVKKKLKESEKIHMNENTYTDGERSPLWGVSSISPQQLLDGGIPFCFNPETKKAVILFEGRRRISSVVGIYNISSVPQIIRSKKAILAFLTDNKEIKPKDKSATLNSFQYGYGVEWRRLTGEYLPQVEICQIIAEMYIQKLEDLSDYLLRERTDLVPELVAHYQYYRLFIKGFPESSSLEKIDKTIKNGFQQIADSIHYSPAPDHKGVW